MAKLEFFKHYPTTLDILGVPIALKVKRYTRDEMDALETRYRAAAATRGTAPIDPEQVKANDDASRALVEALVREAITLEAGQISDDGADVVDGDGLIGLFHQRRDILGDLAAAVILQNRAAGQYAKNSSSPRAFDTGSPARTKVRDGAEPASTAASVESSSTAPIVAATASSSDEATDPLALSGPLETVAG